MIKDLNKKVFKHHIYTEYYNAVLDFIRILGLKKTSNITFGKKPQILKKHLIQKDKKKCRSITHDN